MKQSQIQKGSSIKKMRENFSRQIRKSQIQKMQKDKRQKQLKFTNPTWYIPKLKTLLTQKELSIQDCKEAIQFLSQNIRDPKFADVVQNEQIIQILIIMLTQTFDPWNNSQPKKMHDQNKCTASNQYNFSTQCQCLDCSDSSTAISQINDRTYYQEIQIDGPFHESCSFKNQKIVQGIKKLSFDSKTRQCSSIFNQLLNLLEYIFCHYSNFNEVRKNKYTSGIRYQLDKFNFLFINLSEILENFIIDIINFRKNASLQQNMNKSLEILNKQPFTMKLILQIMSFIEKIGKIFYFEEQHWTILFEIYSRHLPQQQTQVKYLHENRNQIKQLFSIVSKSFVRNQILSDSRNINSINKLMYPWIKIINEALRNLSNERNLCKNSLHNIFQREFQLALNILKHMKFIQKSLNQEIKQILGQLLNISKLLEKEQFDSNTQFKLMYISSRTVQSEESQVAKKCKFYTQRLIEILYLQMQLSDNDLYKISEVQPSTKNKIEQIIDADMY